MKKEALKQLWGTYEKAAKALGLTKGALPQWENELKPYQIDRVAGAALRTGVYRPDLFPAPSVSEKGVGNG